MSRNNPYELWHAANAREDDADDFMDRLTFAEPDNTRAADPGLPIEPELPPESEMGITSKDEFGKIVGKRKPKQVLTREEEIREAEKKFAGGMVAGPVELASEFVPLIGGLSVGDARDAYMAYEDPSLLNIGIASLGAIPLAGGALSGVARRMKKGAKLPAYKQNLTPSEEELLLDLTPSNAPAGERFYSGPDRVGAYGDATREAEETQKVADYFEAERVGGPDHLEKMKRMQNVSDATNMRRIELEAELDDLQESFYDVTGFEEESSEFFGKAMDTPEKEKTRQLIARQKDKIVELADQEKVDFAAIMASRTDGEIDATRRALKSQELAAIPRGKKNQIIGRWDKKNAARAEAQGYVEVYPMEGREIDIDNLSGEGGVTSHGTKAIVDRFAAEKLGETTGARSAKKGFFFARDHDGGTKTAEWYANHASPDQRPELQAIANKDRAAAQAEYAKFNDAADEAKRKKEHYFDTALDLDSATQMREAAIQELMDDPAMLAKARKRLGLVAPGDPKTAILQSDQKIALERERVAKEAIAAHPSYNGPKKISALKRVSDAESEVFRIQRELNVGVTDEQVLESLADDFSVRRMVERANDSMNPRYEGVYNDAMVLLKRAQENGRTSVDYSKRLDRYKREYASKNLDVIKASDAELKASMTYNEIIDEIASRSKGENIIPVRVRLENPMEYDYEGTSYIERTEGGKHRGYNDLLKEAKAKGHDGMILRNTHDGGPRTDVYIVFDAENVRRVDARHDPKMAPSPTAEARREAAEANLERREWGDRKFSRMDFVLDHPEDIAKSKYKGDEAALQRKYEAELGMAPAEGATREMHEDFSSFKRWSETPPLTTVSKASTEMREKAIKSLKETGGISNAEISAKSFETTTTKDLVRRAKTSLQIQIHKLQSVESPEKDTYDRLNAYLRGDMGVSTELGFPGEYAPAVEVYEEARRILEDAGDLAMLKRPALDTLERGRAQSDEMHEVITAARDNMETAAYGTAKLSGRRSLGDMEADLSNEYATARKARRAEEMAKTDVYQKNQEGTFVGAIEEKEAMDAVEDILEEDKILNAVRYKSKAINKDRGDLERGKRGVGDRINRHRYKKEEAHGEFKDRVRQEGKDAQKSIIEEGFPARRQAKGLLSPEAQQQAIDAQTLELGEKLRHFYEESGITTINEVTPKLESPSDIAIAMFKFKKKYSPLASPGDKSAPANLIRAITMQGEDIGNLIKFKNADGYNVIAKSEAANQLGTVEKGKAFLMPAEVKQQVQAFDEYPTLTSHPTDRARAEEMHAEALKVFEEEALRNPDMVLPGIDWANVTIGEVVADPNFALGILQSPGEASIFVKAARDLLVMRHDPTRKIDDIIKAGQGLLLSGTGAAIGLDRITNRKGEEIE